MKITGAFLAEKVEARSNGLYVEGGVFGSLQQDTESDDQLVWLVVLVERSGQGEQSDVENYKFTAKAEPLEVASGTTSGKSFSLEVGPESLVVGTGYSADLLSFSRKDLPVDGMYTLVVVGPHGESFTLPFMVGTGPSGIS